MGDMRLPQMKEAALIHWDEYLGFGVSGPRIRYLQDAFSFLGNGRPYQRHNYDVNELEKTLEDVGNRALQKKDVDRFSLLARKVSKSSKIAGLPPLPTGCSRAKGTVSWMESIHTSENQEHMFLISRRQVDRSFGTETQSSINGSIKLDGNLDDTHQKFEWHISHDQFRGSISDDFKRIKERFNGRLIQIRPSPGIRVSAGTRHPALVAIGQVPIHGTYMKRPRPHHLKVELQSIDPDFVRRKKGLHGTDSQTIKALGKCGER